MKSKLNCCLVLFFLCSFTITPGVSWAQKKKVYIHPSFKLLLTLYPRKKTQAIVRPMVPRIHAKTALNLYSTNKAIFFAGGEMAIKAALPGAINITNDMLKNPPEKFLKKHRNKLIVIFCH